MKRKKKSHPDWHPNFRIEDELPDIKPIRTDFLVNGIAWALALFLLFAVVQREITAASVKGRLTDTRAQISQFTQANKSQLAQSKKFTDTLPRFEDIERFYAAPFETTDYIMQVAARIPEEIILREIVTSTDTAVVKKKSTLSYSLSLSGTAPSLTTIDSLKEQITEIELFQTYNGTVRELPSARDAITGLFSFTIEVTLTPTYK